MLSGQPRHSTTAIASVVLTLAGVGIAMSASSLYGALRLGSREAAEAYAVLKQTMKMDLMSSRPAADILLTNALLSLASKLCLVATGVAIALRSRRATSVILVGIAVSAVDSLYYILAVLPISAVSSLSTPAPCSICALIVGALSICGYIAILVYLRRPATRIEFGAAAHVAA